MGYLTLEDIKRAGDLLVPAIFTGRQLGVVIKKMEGRKLNMNERVYYSSSIRRKMRAMESLFNMQERYYTYGPMIRGDKAIKILKQTERVHKWMRILISGSFLFSRKYNDIDVFIISKYRRGDCRRGRVHFNYLDEGCCNTLFFKSLSAICVSNFRVSSEVKEKVSLSSIMSYYMELVDNIINHRSLIKGSLRDFLLYSTYTCNKAVLDPKQLKDYTDSIMRNKNRIAIIRKIFINTIISSFNMEEVGKKSSEMVKSYEELKKGYGASKVYDIMIDSFREALEVGS